MQRDLDFDDILEQYRADPYSYVEIAAAHTGVVTFQVAAGDEVRGPSGKFHHIPGTCLYRLLREGNSKPCHSPVNGTVSRLATELDGQFVEAATPLVTIRHPLKKREIIDRMLRRVLTPVTAPERAKYFFSLDVQSRIDKFGQRAVTIRPGDELFTMSLMKRDTPVFYEGDPGIIHTVYFTPGVTVEAGAPLIGVCSKETLPVIDKIINRVKAEWE